VGTLHCVRPLRVRTSDDLLLSLCAILVVRADRLALYSAALTRRRHRRRRGRGGSLSALLPPPAASSRLHPSPATGADACVVVVAAVPAATTVPIATAAAAAAAATVLIVAIDHIFPLKHPDERHAGPLEVPVCVVSRDTLRAVGFVTFIL
jgi:hypothetical protein